MHTNVDVCLPRSLVRHFQCGCNLLSLFCGVFISRVLSLLLVLQPFSYVFGIFGWIIGSVDCGLAATTCVVLGALLKDLFIRNCLNQLQIHQ